MNTLAPYQLQLLESIIAILVYVISFFVTRNIINKSLKKNTVRTNQKKNNHQSLTSHHNNHLYYVFGRDMGR
jgi:hypothetical protein